MHERPYWWQTEDNGRPGYNQSGRRDFAGQRRGERPYWWSEDDLPERDEHLRPDLDRYDDEERSHHLRNRDDRYARSDDDSEYRRGRSRIGDKMKAFFGSDRAERRLDHDRRYHDSEHRHHSHHRDRGNGASGYGGVGPRTRHEEDDELCEQLCQRFADDAQLDASEILVRVIDNEAILDGAVRSRRDAQRAYDIAHDIPGIVHVRDRIEVVGRGRDRVRRATIGMGYEGNTRRWS